MWDLSTQEPLISLNLSIIFILEEGHKGGRGRKYEKTSTLQDEHHDSTTNLNTKHQ